MSEPQSPPPAPSVQKKGISPLAWVLIGCFGLLLVGAVGMGACGLFVAKKVGNVAEDFAENPGRAMAEMAVKVNPDLELVESDDSAETVTVKDKKTGEVYTLDWSEIEKGNFSMKSKEGSFSIDASGGEDGAVMTMTGEDGQKTQIFGGGSAEKIPDWAPIAPGASKPQSLFSTSDGTSTNGVFTYTVSSSVADVLDFYEETLTDEGYNVTKSTFSSGGKDGGMVGGRNDSGRSVSASVGAADDGVQVSVTYSSGG
jgi:hypothetical protein